MTTIIVINGKDGVGKDTFIKFFKEISKYPVWNFSTVDKIKKVAKKYFYWNNIKDEKGRLLLRDLKKVLKNYNNFPILEFDRKLKKFNKKYPNKKKLIFIHSRENKEIFEILQKYKNTYSLNVYDKQTVKVYPDTDFSIFNDGSLEDLKKSTQLFYNEVRSKIL